MDKARSELSLKNGDVLILIDIQNDYLPGGSLAVPQSDEIIPVINAYIERFVDHGLTIVAARDWHPHDHSSFNEQGGTLPAHCIADTPGSAFPKSLQLPEDARIISKTSSADQEGLSAFDGTRLLALLQRIEAKRLFIAGLATDTSILHTALEAAQHPCTVFLLLDAVRAFNRTPYDGENAIAKMKAAGVLTTRLSRLKES